MENKFFKSIWVSICGFWFCFACAGVYWAAWVRADLREQVRKADGLYEQSLQTIDAYRAMWLFEVKKNDDIENMFPAGISDAMKLKISMENAELNNGVDKSSTVELP